MSAIERIIYSWLKVQPSLARRIPEEKRRMREGRIGKLVVDDPTGKNHTVMYFQVKDCLLCPLQDTPANIRNHVLFKGDPLFGYTGLQLFYDLVSGEV